MKKQFIFLSLIIISITASAQVKEIHLWPNGAPNTNGLVGEETQFDNGRVGNVSQPEMYVYLPQSVKPTAAVIICPGGGYVRLAMNSEGHEFAQWLNSLGIAGIVLKYRMPNGHSDVPLSDAQQALRIVRQNCQQWNISPDKIGIAGFSAGGHLASTVATHITDSVTRPAFTILFYPVISTDANIAHSGSVHALLGENPDKESVYKYSNEKHVTAQTPSTALFLSDNDRTVPPRNSTDFYNALKQNHVPAVLYIFPEGDHGWGMNSDFAYRSQWQELLKKWLLQITNKPVLAFPGAEGFGQYTTGGRGGKVLFVDNLNDSGPGSLREAVQTPGTRTVIFRVSGTIFLQSPLIIEKDSITLAGQTAPGDGICLANHPVEVSADNVIIRYMRFRMGDTGREEDDALGGVRRKDIIVDHCSMSWSTDECSSFYDNANFTMQWCILSESLRNSIHHKGPHGYGGIWGGMNATFHHNLLAHHTSRNPRFCGARYHEKTKETEMADFRNNVIYNWGFNSSYAGENGRYNIVNNYYKPGPATENNVRSRILEAWQSKDHNGFHDFGRFYIDGNIMDGNASVTADNWKGVDYKLFIESEGIDSTEQRNDSLYQRCHTNQPFKYIITTQHTAQEAYDAVLKQAGASLVRDSIDSRIIREVRNGSFTYGDKGMIDSQSQVGGWCKLTSLPAPVDSDNDGIPDKWEDAHGLNKHDAADGNAYTLNADYTNLEMYLNSLVR